MATIARRGVTVKDVPAAWLEPGHGLAPDAPVIVTVEIEDAPPRRLTDFIGRGRGLYASIADADAFLRDERDAWGR